MAKQDFSKYTHIRVYREDYDKFKAIATERHISSIALFENVVTSINKLNIEYNKDIKEMNR